jgi:hypothetical protein
VTHCPRRRQATNALRQKRNFPSNLNVIWVVQTCREKYIASGIPQISCFIRPVPFLRGAYRDRHERGAGLRWTRSAVRNPLRGRAALLADGEAVWSWRPDAGAKLAKTLTRLAGDGGKRARSPGRARSKPLKPSRRECRTIAVCPWLLTPVLSCCTGGQGCNARPAFPAPSAFRWACSSHNSGVTRRGTVESRLGYADAVIARSNATKQSRAKERLPARPWIASLRSQ